MCLSFVISTVGTANCLQQGVILHGLVQIHNLEDRSIETSQQFSCNNYDFQRIVRISESIQNLSFFLLGAAICFVLVCLIIIGVHDNGRAFLAKQLIKLSLILDTARSVIYNNLSLISIRSDLFSEVLCNVCAHLMDTGIVIHDRLHIHALGKLCSIGIRHVLCQYVKFAVHGITVHAEIDWHRLKVQRKCCMVTDRIREGILTHVSAAILGSTKSCKGILIQTVDRSTGQSEEECIRQSCSHLNSKITLLGSMALIDHDDNIIALTELTGNFLKTENGRNDYLADVLTKHCH